MLHAQFLYFSYRLPLQSLKFILKMSNHLMTFKSLITSKDQLKMNTHSYTVRHYYNVVMPRFLVIYRRKCRSNILKSTFFEYHHDKRNIPVMRDLFFIVDL